MRRKEEADSDFFIRVKKASLRYKYYAYLDTYPYLADGLFVAHRIAVMYDDEYEKSGAKYRIVFCHVGKEDAKEFEEMLEILPERMAACGFEDYPEYVSKFVNDIRTAARDKRRGKPAAKQEDRSA